MQKTSTATIPNSLALAAVLAAMLLLVLLSISSNGIVRSGGEDDDGSGIGGTGRMLVPGSGSGIGGTGKRPFLGMSEEQEVEILVDPALRDRAIIQALPTTVELTPPMPLELIPRVATVSRHIDRTHDSSALDISEVIQADIDLDAAYFEQLRKQLAVIDGAAIGTVNSVNTSAPASATSDSTSRQATWDQVAAFLNASQSQLPGAESSSLANASISPANPARLNRPERVQRPELPPVQRVSPLQRTAILPPRVRPLRL